MLERFHNIPEETYPRLRPNVSLHRARARLYPNGIRSTHSRSLPKGSWLEALGIQGTMVRSKAKNYITYAVSLRYRLPFSQIFGARFFVVDLTLCHFPLYGSISPLDQGGIAVRNLVPENSEIMTACLKGDLFRVQELFRVSKARPDDVTTNNSTPLRVSAAYILRFL